METPDYLDWDDVPPDLDADARRAWRNLADFNRETPVLSALRPEIIHLCKTYAASRQRETHNPY